MLANHQKDCLNINGAHSLKLEKGTIKFKNYFKQIPVPFKIDLDLESNLGSAEIYEGSCSRKYQSHIPCSLLTKLFVLIIVLRSQLSFLEAKMLLTNLLKQFLKSMNTVIKNEKTL